MLEVSIGQFHSLPAMLNPARESLSVLMRVDMRGLGLLSM
jgi:hypothetical protein